MAEDPVICTCLDMCKSEIVAAIREKGLKTVEEVGDSNGRRPGAGRVALHAHPHPHPRGLLQGVPHQPLAGRHGVCGHCGQLPVAVFAH